MGMAGAAGLTPKDAEPPAGAVPPPPLHGPESDQPDKGEKRQA
jgi:hypothetical protein